MAATAISLHLRTNKPLRASTFLYHFSSSTSSSPPPPNPSFDPQTPNSPPPNPQSSFSSYVSDVKSSLRQPPPPPRQQQGQYRRGFTPPPPPTQAAEQIRKNLSEFRARTAAPKSGDGSSPLRISFQELYKRNVSLKEGDGANEANKGGKPSFDAIRASLSQLQAKIPKTNEGPLFLKKARESFTLRPGNSGNNPFVNGPQKKVPEPVFSNDLNDKKDEKVSLAMKTEFVKMYSYKELGEKLRKLRPEGKSEGGFSLHELNERLVKLREMEEKDKALKINHVTFRDLRESLAKLKFTENKQTLHKIDLLNYMGQTPTFMLHPPKDHLVEKVSSVTRHVRQCVFRAHIMQFRKDEEAIRKKYFHPDNMSSAEKLKIELQKVRDEFKMSESDCGSARVQVAQLTTKIKHLATVLHKKDIHSRKGLQEMIQHRKKLLKYLRRTDWDSYTLVLSKLGLRDNPDYKN